MDKKNLNFKWISSVLVLTVTAVGIYYYYYCKSKNSNHEKEKTCVSKPSLEDKREQANIKKKEGNNYYNSGQYEKAIDCYDIAIMDCPRCYQQDIATLYQNKAASLYNCGKFEEALLFVNFSLEFSPRYKTALIRRCKIYESLYQYQDALFDIAAAVIFDNSDKSDSVDRMENIVKIIAMNVVKKELLKHPVFQSEFSITTHFESFPNDPFYLIVKHYERQSGDSDLHDIDEVVELFKTKKYQECFHAVEKVLSTNLDLSADVKVQLYLLRGTFYSLCCREDLAHADFDAVIENPNSNPILKANALVKLAILTSDNTGNTEVMFDKALALNSDCADIFYHRGVSHELAGRKEAALNDYKNALSLYPDYSFAAAHRLYNEFMLADAISEDYFEEFRSLLTKFPTCPEIQRLFLKVLIDKEKFEEAEQIFANLMLSESKSGIMMSLIARMKMSQNKESEATEILMNAIKCDPTHVESYKLLADINIRNEDLDKAIGYLDSAIKFAKNKNEMREYVELKEGILAQLNVSTRFDIPLRNIMNEVFELS